MKKESFFGDVRKHLMSGVSYMLPIIIIYAFFTTLSGMLDGTAFGELCGVISTAGASLIGVVLAAYIAYSIAGKVALGPTFVVALVSDQLGMGFIGGLIVGLLMGYLVKVIVLLMGKLKQGQLNDILTSWIIIPMIGTLIGGALIYFVIGNPVVSAMEAVYTWLENMSTGSSVLLALILGGMIAFDMGGPVNKVAYAFALAAFEAGLLKIVGPVMVAITIPVLALGLATLIFKNRYDEEERFQGKTALFMSMFGLTEGAIPFAVMNPFRVIPALMIGSMTGSALAAILGVESGAPVPALPGLAMGFTTFGNALLFILCHIVGVAVCIAMLLILKKKPEVEVAAAE